jgi:hypothetical protein
MPVGKRCGVYQAATLDGVLHHSADLDRELVVTVLVYHVPV